jgi:hypothetical protein
LINWELSLISRFRFGPVLTAVCAFLGASLQTNAALQLKILALHHQIGVLQRSVKRPKLTAADRCLWAWLCSVWDGWEARVSIIQAATVIGWQRKAFGWFVELEDSPRQARPPAVTERRARVDPHAEPRKPTMGCSSHSTANF